MSNSVSQVAADVSVKEPVNVSSSTPASNEGSQEAPASADDASDKSGNAAPVESSDAQSDSPAEQPSEQSAAQGASDTQASTEGSQEGPASVDGASDGSGSSGVDQATPVESADAASHLQPIDQGNEQAATLGSNEGIQEEPVSTDGSSGVDQAAPVDQGNQQVTSETSGFPESSSGEQPAGFPDTEPTSDVTEYDAGSGDVQGDEE